MPPSIRQAAKSQLEPVPPGVSIVVSDGEVAPEIIIDSDTYAPSSVSTLSAKSRANLNRLNLNVLRAISLTGPSRRRVTERLG